MLTIAANTRQQVNNLRAYPNFPLTNNITLGPYQSTGNAIQTITLDGGAGNYLFSWNINAQQTNGSTNNEFELYQNGSRIYYNWYGFSGLENITGSLMVHQTTATATYNFAATATAGGSYRLNGFGLSWTQISIMKLF